MAHPRKLIRAKVALLLVAGATVAATRVFPSRVLVVANKEVTPLIFVFTNEEEVDANDTAPRELTRTLDLVVVGLIPGSDAVVIEDALDDLAEEIETVMHADPQLGGDAGDSVLTGTVLDVQQVGDRLIGTVELTYSVTYRTDAPEAPTTLADFKTAATATSVIALTAEGTGDALAKSVNTMTLTDAAAAFDALWIGQDIWLDDSTSPDNNGRFAITAVLSPTQIQFLNTKGVAEAFAGEWKIVSPDADSDDITVQI